MTTSMPTTAEPRKPAFLDKPWLFAPHEETGLNVPEESITSGHVYDSEHSINTTLNQNGLRLTVLSLLPPKGQGIFPNASGWGDSRWDAELHAALRELQEATDEASEEGALLPSEPAIANASRLIREMYDILPRRYLVEILPEGVIAVSVPGGFRCSVMLLCESDGGALCSVNMNGEHRRARYSHADQLPDGFLREALDELERGEAGWIV